jgi:hypothetical protein
MPGTQKGQKQGAPKTTQAKWHEHKTQAQDTSTRHKHKTQAQTAAQEHMSDEHQPEMRAEILCVGGAHMYSFRRLASRRGLGLGLLQDA